MTNPLADLVEMRPVAQLMPYARNARTHSKAQIKEIAGAIETYGWTMPIVEDEARMIIAGHGRVLGANDIYSRGGVIKMINGTELPKGMVPVITARGWDDRKKREYVLADNQIALRSGWDKKLLTAELSDLRAMGATLNDLGFADKELAKLGVITLEASAAPQLGGLKYSIIIDCDDEDSQSDLLNKLIASGVKKCRALIS